MRHNASDNRYQYIQYGDKISFADNVSTFNPKTIGTHTICANSTVSSNRTMPFL